MVLFKIELIGLVAELNKNDAFAPPEAGQIPGFSDSQQVFY